MSRASSKLARVGLVIEAEILALGEGLCIASRLGLINLMVERYLVLVIAWKRAKAMKSYWKKRELTFLILYALLFYIVIIRRSLQISHDYYRKVLGLRPGWVADQLNKGPIFRKSHQKDDPFSGNMIKRTHFQKILWQNNWF
ncbi:hypothetical protein CK203_091015 [Vitis vinifera]|uniref:Uncharacterized protein n=1 Tax=Vitis vinifera TaxID=29760 RepID=A0A438BV65_VITVI|nr:hypothetical protein CK203_091015 [Vitis vinifera]